MIVCINLLQQCFFSSTVVAFFHIRVADFCRLSSVTLRRTPTIPHRLDEAKQWTVLLTGIEFKSKLGWMTQGHSGIILEVAPVLFGLLLCQNRSSNTPRRPTPLPPDEQALRNAFCCRLRKSFAGDPWTPDGFHQTPDKLPCTLHGSL